MDVGIAVVAARLGVGLWVGLLGLFAGASARLLGVLGLLGLLRIAAARLLGILGLLRVFGVFGLLRLLGFLGDRRLAGRALLLGGGLLPGGVQLGGRRGPRWPAFRWAWRRRGSWSGG